jgi:hypothetical protein
LRPLIRPAIALTAAILLLALVATIGGITTKGLYRDNDFILLAWWACLQLHILEQSSFPNLDFELCGSWSAFHRSNAALKTPITPASPVPICAQGVGSTHHSRRAYPNPVA